MAQVILQNLVLGSSISISFMLAGNAITQSFMTVPALLVDFPTQTSPPYSARATLLGRQWPVCWKIGNIFFRPISTLSALGYGFTTYCAFTSKTTKADWRLFACVTFLHVVVILHSAINMQPLNDKLAALDPDSKEAENSGHHQLSAEALMKKWGTYNIVRIVVPGIAGIIALSQLFL